MVLKNKLFRYLLNIDLLISCIALSILVVITFSGVIMRYFMNNPFIWLEEVQLWLFMWVTFFGASAAFRTGSHMAIEFIVDQLPPNIRKVMEILISLVVIIALLYLMINGAKLVEQMINTNRVTNILKIPYPLIYSAVPVGCALMMISHILMVGSSILSKNADYMKGGAK